MLMVESDLPGAAARAEMDAARVVCASAGATSVVQSADAAEADWLRQARRSAFHALERLGTVRMEDVGVPRARVPELLVAIAGIAAKYGVRCGTFGHAGDGNIHPNFVFERDDPDAARITEAARGELYAAAIALGGTITGEHGVGLARRDYLEQQRGPGAMRVMRQIKDALDPQGILNPGRVLR
jgi:glycolate oxidase